MTIEFKSQGINERGILTGFDFAYLPEKASEWLKTGMEVLAIDPRYFRPAEVDLLVGDASKAKAKLGWEPTLGLDELVKDMVQSDLSLVRQEALLRDHGYPLQQGRG